MHGVKGSPRRKLLISLSRLSFASWLAHTQAGSAEGRARPGRPAATDLEKEVGAGAGSCVVVSPSGSFSVCLPLHLRTYGVNPRRVKPHSLPLRFGRDFHSGLRRASVFWLRVMQRDLSALLA